MSIKISNMLNKVSFDMISNMLYKISDMLYKVSHIGYKISYLLAIFIQSNKISHLVYQIGK